MQSSSKSVEPTVSPDRVYSPLELSGRAPSPLIKVASDRMDQGFDRVLNCLGGQKAQCNGTSIEIQSMSPLAEAMCAYAVNHSAPRSLRATKSIASKGIDGGPVQVNLGLGETEVMWEGQSLLLTHQALGKPHWSGGRFSTVVLSSTLEGSDVRESMLRLLAHALQEYETAKASHVTLFSFNAKSGYWQRDREIRKRELESIILPPAALATIVEDARRFLTEDAQEWYGKHGVPYKRTYCLHGPPGCGKTSLVSAVASEFDANVCMLSLADPDLKDSGLRAAMQHVPKRSVIVFEDVDAVFNHHREKTEHTCLVTFSGLLNALDGVGEPSGTLFFLTTNHIDRLDPALVRPGRVDVQLKLELASNDQIGRMLSRFYEHATETDRAAFVTAVRAAEGGRHLSMAQLQEHFVQHRLSSLETAIASIRIAPTTTSRCSAHEGMWS